MPDLEYDIKPVSVLRDDIEAAAAGWPLAEGTTFQSTSCDGVACEWIQVPPAVADGGVYLHAHGGGYYRGSARVDAAICSHLCEMTGIGCLSVNYRRPPDEGVFPAAVDDMYSVWRWLIDPAEGGVSPADVVVGGTSAGGGLCLSLLLRIRDEQAALPAAAILVSPWTDLTQSGASFVTNAQHGPLAAYLQHWAAVYLDGADARHPHASPLFADLQGLPPMLIQAGGDETMLDDATLFAAAAARAGVAVTLQVYPGQPHSFQHDVGTSAVAREAVSNMAQFTQRCFVTHDDLPRP
ncbi:MAG: alpha/beta hydrolase fold domain-containing protein [bacterium]|nr:alpha/beta hydrolase fold domain-containing protein [bacterium]